ncbi:MAG: metal-dependent hydrolase [Planctomycetes bacterium]|nr:metal-dependent hydrolase [Planctomycetota bacterium]
MSATITWLGHATIRLVLPDERVILIDPWLADNPGCPEQFKTVSRCDMILLTHGHFDHVGEVATLIESFDPPVVANADLCSALQKTIGAGRYQGMNTGGTQTVDGVRISMTQAFHSSGLDTPGGPMYGGMPNGLVVSADALAPIYHAGDTDVFGDMKLIAQFFQPKIAILPIGDHFTMGARGAALATEMLEPETIIPVHYGTFPVLAPSAEEFRQALAPEWREHLVVPKVGEALTWTGAGVG